MLLGAGPDSRPYRLADRLEGLRVFEDSLRRATGPPSLRGFAACSAREPRGVRFVPLDFTRDDLATEMGGG